MIASIILIHPFLNSIWELLNKKMWKKLIIQLIACILFFTFLSAFVNWAYLVYSNDKDHWKNILWQLRWWLVPFFFIVIYNIIRIATQGSPLYRALLKSEKLRLAYTKFFFAWIIYTIVFIVLVYSIHFF